MSLQPAFDFGDDELDDAANPTYSVGELAEAINDALRRGFSDGVWVRGEITGWSDRGQHAYFTLVDDADTSQRGGNGRGKAVVNVQFFANARMRLRPMLQKHRLRLADGMKVHVFRLPRLLRPQRPDRPEDDRHRPEVHTR